MTTPTCAPLVCCSYCVCLHATHTREAGAQVDGEVTGEELARVQKELAASEAAAVEGAVATARCRRLQADLAEATAELRRLSDLEGAPAPSPLPVPAALLNAVLKFISRRSIMTNDDTSS